MRKNILVITISIIMMLVFSPASVFAQGVTTAASLWATAAIGLTAGIGDYPIAAMVTLLVVIILASNSLLKRIGLEKD